MTLAHIRRVLLVAMTFLGPLSAVDAQDAPEDRDAPENADEAAPIDEEEAARMEQARAYFVSGMELARRERWGEALAYFELSKRLLPDRVNTRFNLAGVYLRVGRANDAIREYEYFLEHSPRTPIRPRFKSRATH